VSKYVVAWIAPTFVNRYTQNFGKLSVIVKAWIGLISEKNYFGRGLSLIFEYIVTCIAPSFVD
jgi:hypothetical protein